MSAAITIDARGHRCPVPTLRLSQALRAAAIGDAIVLLADDPMARIDVPHYCCESGHEVLSIEPSETWTVFTVRKQAEPSS